MLQGISDQRVREEVLARANKLRTDPEKQRKALLGELAGLRSLRTVGQRYRIIYRVERGRVLVLVVSVGIRKQGSRRDIYELARKLLHSRLIE
jgi:mRNA interferase RelE/StbE